MVEITPAALPAANDPVAIAAALAAVPATPAVVPAAAPAAPAVVPAAAPAAVPAAAPVADPAAPVADPAAPAAPGTPDPAKTGDGTADPAAPMGAPDQYAAFTLPEGMEMNVAALEQFAPLAKELDLSQEQAQKLVTMDAQRELARTQSSQEAVDNMMDAWREETKSDPVVGGANLDTSLAQTRVFLNKFATPALLDLLDSTGIGNNIDFIRLCSGAGKAMGEDGVSSSGLKPVDKRSPEEILYPNQEV